MRAVWVAAAACALAACSQGGVASGGATEEAVAAKIVDAAGVLDLGESTLKEVVNAQIQLVGYDHPNLTPEQAEQLAAAIKKNIDEAMPNLKKEMSGFLAETFDKKELDTYFAFVGSKEGEQVKQKIPTVMEKSIAAADQMTTAAVQKALTDLKIPEAAPPQPAQPEPVVPGVVKKPTDPQ